VTDNSGYRCVDSDLVYNSRTGDLKSTLWGMRSIFRQLPLTSWGTIGFGSLRGGRDLSGPGGASSGCGPVVLGATMFYAISQGDTSQRTLDLDDIAGITAIYPKWTIAGAVLTIAPASHFLTQRSN
jgi:hypothetical protein